MVTMYTSYDKEGATKYTIKNYEIYLHRDRGHFFGHIDSTINKTRGNGFNYYSNIVHYDRPYEIPKYVDEYLYKLI